MSGEPCRACWKGFNVALFTVALANALPRKVVADISTDEAAIAAVALSAARHANTAVVLLSTHATRTCPPPLRGKIRKSSADSQHLYYCTATNRYQVSTRKGNQHLSPKGTVLVSFAYTRLV